MPTVLRVDGFRIVIFASQREHGPAHVHVFHSGEEVVIELRTSEEGVAVRDFRGTAHAADSRGGRHC
jgi:hypothetical protein